MSGHSKWSQIKHQKGATDQKRGALFSKLSAAITTAVGNEPNPQFNSRLRAAIDKARANQMPGEIIERAIKRAADKSIALEELLFEAYGPGGAALLIEAVTDSRNRAVAEIKKILHDHDVKLAESGSVLWAFEGLSKSGWRPKFTQTLDDQTNKKLEELISTLQEHPDIQNIISNAVIGEKTSPQ